MSVLFCAGVAAAWELHGPVCQHGAVYQHGPVYPARPIIVYSAFAARCIRHGRTFPPNTLSIPCFFVWEVCNKNAEYTDFAPNTPSCRIHGGVFGVCVFMPTSCIQRRIHGDSAEHTEIPLNTRGFRRIHGDSAEYTERRIHGAPFFQFFPQILYGFTVFCLNAQNPVHIGKGCWT